MSVTTSSANVDPPPLLFGQRSPTPPSFASFPQTASQSPTSPRAHPPLFPDDPGLSQNNPHPPAPTVDQSESEDSDMDDTDGSEELPAHLIRSGAPLDPAPPPSGPAMALREEQDAMDTSPDAPGSFTFGRPNAPPLSLDFLGSPPAPPSSAPANEHPIPTIGDALTRVNSRGSSIDSAGDPNEHPLVPPPPPPPAVVPPQSTPGSPRAGGAAGEHEETSDDEEDVLPPWRELKEDTSVPNEEELREIEAMGEHSALDDEYWQRRTFQDLDDPEYTPGPTGRVDWTISNYNGTRENPNRELLMKSPVVNVGGYDWQIKFYPRGNDSDFLSVYVECLSVARKENQNDASAPERALGVNSETPNLHAKPRPSSTAAPSTEYRQGPLPLLTEEPVLKRRSVAAQVSVVLYNPAEPRTNYFRQCSHRFCPDSPDWGWTRFAGPYFEIHYRQRGQRQALLRNDKLVLTAHIRIINDPTECLWEHHSRENRWDSFAMTGLQGLADSEYESHGGSLIAAVSSWMLLKPFRKFLYELELADPTKEARAKPKPLLSALQRTIYKLRTDVLPGSGPVDLDDVADALEWYGTDSSLSKLDVIEIWEILRAKIEYELADTPSRDKLKDLFGPERDRMMNMPTYRAPVTGCADMQAAIDKSVNLVQPGAPLPEVLHVELERQEFNREAHSMRKRADKVKLLEKVTIHKTAYILYGFIVHRDSLQSGSYYSVVRPKGPGGKWYAYYDGKEENRVVCLTRRQAIEAHEGGGTEKSAVAYIVMYVRQDVVPKQFSKDEPKWEVPQWLKNRSPCGRKQSVFETTEETLDYQVFDSAAFTQHEGPGTMDPSDRKWETSPYRTNVKLPASASAREVRKLLAQQFQAKDPRQVKFWFLDHPNGTSHRPTMRSSSTIEDPRDDPDQSPTWTLKTAAEHRPERRIWVHVLDFADLPELPKPTTSVSEVPESGIAGVPHSEDSPMNDAEENGNHPDEQMDLVITEGLAAQAARQHAVDVTGDPAFAIPRPPHTSVADGSDTEMANNIEAVHAMPPPPPPPMSADFITPPLQSMDNVVVITNPNIPPFDFAVPPPITHNLTASHEEIYYFLKEFEPESQTLRAHKTVVAKKSDRIDHSVLDALDWPRDVPFDLFEEEAPTVVTRLQRGGVSFNQAGIHSTAILIAQARLSSEQRSALASRALFSDPVDYVQHATAARFVTSTTPLTGHFTMDYFSSEHYMGVLVRGRPHGSGCHLYFDGSEYVGSYRLGQRHGNGRLTYPNGDVYEGEWVDNLPEGRGSFIEAETGNSYLGGWKAGKKFGEGVTHWKNAQEIERLCRICWEDGADAAFYDCGHVVACLSCARRVDNCPVCRRRVLSAMKLYFGN
ncbi:math and uch domain protein [Diplodia corticola]|uniref:Math and uch domain protein n=1 Tax=Diplodia corticola TaxID=236234 RepID=A0A1J9QKB0_9PEZI|nr:math and uch domain protein [Diplodia corticola]OJD28913.1 math and uch domain protein [Diplodia corticola]